MNETNAKQESARQEFALLLHDDWDFRMREDPLFATIAGDSRFNNRLPEVTEEAFARRLEGLRRTRSRLEKIEHQSLPAVERLNHDIFRRLLENDIRELEFHGYRIPISKTGGFHTDFPDSLPNIVPLETVQDYENYIARLAGFASYTGQYIELMRGALSTGWAPARVTLAGVGEAVKKSIVEDPAESPLLAPFSHFPAAVGGTDRERLEKEARQTLAGSVAPAYAALLRFVQEEYLPGSREEIGASHLPDGAEFYRHRIRYFTSLDLSPEQVHETGQSEVRRIRAEMEEVMRRAGYRDLKTLVEFLRTDPRFYAQTPDTLLKETAYVLKRMDGELPRLFKTLPRTPYGIRPIPEASAPGNTTAYYFPPTGDGRTAGVYYVNTYDLKSRPFYEIEALSLHEAVPGHHLQIALQQELDLPNFRRFGGFTSFVEGWALYAERLGLETGFYTDPYSNFGRLSYEMWRACRLVVDTGMHALGWRRDQAIEFMAANTSLTLLNIQNEVDRYIAWPGQALAYKIGELKIRELRLRAEQKLGARFNLREFHDLILGSGAVPLDVLEEMVAAWIA